MKAIILPLCVLGLMTTALADDIRPQLKAMDDAVCKAMQKKDLVAFDNALKGVISPDFKYYETPASKPMTYAQMLSEMKMGLGMMTKVNLVDTRLLSVKSAGDTSTALCIHRMTGLTTGPDKKSHSMSFSGVSIDVFKKVGSGWKYVSMTWKSQEQKMDGHRIQAGK